MLLLVQNTRLMILCLSRLTGSRFFPCRFPFKKISKQLSPPTPPPPQKKYHLRISLQMTINVENTRFHTERHNYEVLRGNGKHSAGMSQLCPKDRKQVASFRLSRAIRADQTLGNPARTTLLFALNVFVKITSPRLLSFLFFSLFLSAHLNICVRRLYAR